MQKKNTSNTKNQVFWTCYSSNTWTTALANAETHSSKGDTLSAIAKKNGTTVDEIVSKNGIQDANKISIGQNLTINETTGETTEPSVTAEATAESTQSTESTQSEDTQSNPIQIFLLQRQLPRRIAQRGQAVAIQLKWAILWTLPISIIIFEWRLVS